MGQNGHILGPVLGVRSGRAQPYALGTTGSRLKPCGQQAFARPGNYRTTSTQFNLISSHDTKAFPWQFILPYVSFVLLNHKALRMLRVRHLDQEPPGASLEAFEIWGAQVVPE